MALVSYWISTSRQLHTGHLRTGGEAEGERVFKKKKKRNKEVSSIVDEF